MNYHDYPEIAIIKDLKEVLKNYRYGGISLNNVYRVQFVGDFWDGRLTKLKISKWEIFFNRLYLLFKLLINNLKAQNNLHELDNSILIETTATDLKLRGFWQPLLKVSKVEKIILLHCSSIEEHIKSNQPVIKTRNLKGDFISVIHWHFKNSHKLIKEIKSVCKKYQLNETSHDLIYNTIVSTIVLMEQYIQLFRKHKPSCFLAIDDQHTNGAIVCSILNSYNIPTFTHVHGAIGTQSMPLFTPLNAKYVLTWGNFMSKLFNTAGINQDRIIEVGCQRSQEKNELTLEQILNLKRQIGIRESRINKPVIMFGFTALITENWINDLMELKEQLHEHFQLTARLHPSQTHQQILKLKLKSDDELIILESQQIKLDDQIMMSEIIIIDSSSLGFDAMLKGKLVIVLDSGNDLKSQAVMYDALQANAAKLCRSTSEVINFLENKTEFEQLKIRSRKFVSNYLIRSGDDAAKEILKVISKN